MAVALTLVDKWHDSKRVHYVGTVALSGSYVTGGETISFLPIMNTQKVPFWVEAIGRSGYVYQWDYTNAKLKVLTGAAAQAALTELTAGAYPGGVSGDQIRLYAVARLV